MFIGFINRRYDIAHRFPAWLGSFFHDAVRMSVIGALWLLLCIAFSVYIENTFKQKEG